MSLGSVNLLKLFFRTNMAATSSSEMIADNPSSENCELLPGFKDVSEYSQVNYMLLSHFVVLYLYGSLLISLFIWFDECGVGANFNHRAKFSLRWARKLDAINES